MKTSLSGRVTVLLLSLAVCLGLPAHADDIHQLAKRGDGTGLEALLATNAAAARLTDKNGNTPLHFAAAADQTNALTLLLDHGADVAATNWNEGLTPLHMAARQGKLAAARTLVARSAPVNAADQHGCRPLHSAVYANQTGIAALLLAHQADVNAARADGSTPLYHAVMGGHTNLVSLLLRHRADGSLATTNGTTPVHVAAKAGRADLAGLLLAGGANVNVGNKQRATPLHLAVQAGAFAVAELLLRHGADADAKDRLGFVPLDFVKGATNDALASLLQEAMKSSREIGSARKVGEVGDPERLEFEGLKSFTAAEIRRGLKEHTTYHLLSHPQANLREFLKQLGTLIEAGYQAAGFPDATAEVKYDPADWRVRIQVTEGARFTEGRLRITGTGTTSEKELVRWLTVPWDGPEDRLLEGPKRPDHSIWKPGDDANFSAAWLKEVTQQVNACLAEQGFFFAQTQLKLQRNDTNHTADLLITLEREGPSGRVGDVEVTGANRHSPGDILRFLELREGARISATRLAAARRKLWDCGRFHSFTITPVVIGAAAPSSERVKVQIEVKELENVPRLGEKLTAEQQACLRLARWAENFSKRGEEMQIRITGTNGNGFAVAAELVLSPKSGLLVSGSYLNGRTPMAAGFCADARTVQLCSWASGARLTTTNQSRITCYLHVLSGESDTNGSNRISLSLGAGLKTRSDSARHPEPFVVEPDILIAPAALLDMTTQSNRACRIRKGELILAGRDEGAMQLRAEARTGRLIEAGYCETNGSIIVRFGKGYWGAAARQFARRAEPLPDLARPGHEISALAGFTLREALHWEYFSLPVESDRRATFELAMRGLDRFVRSEALYPLDEMMAGQGGTSFMIPFEGWENLPEGGSWLWPFIGPTFESNDRLFPKHSWPWTVARETGFVILSQGRYTSDELDRLYQSAATGPIGCLTIASLLNRVESTAANTFAEGGRERLEAANFLADLNPFLRGNGSVARSVHRLAAALRELPEDELGALATFLPEAEGKLLRESAAALRAQPDQPADAVLAPALTRYWEAKLRAQVRDALLKIIRQPKAKGASPQGI